MRTMANYYGVGTSNAVKVTNKVKFKKLCELYSLTYWDEDGKVGFYAESEYGEPELYDENGEELEYFLDAFSRLLKDGEVLIWMHTGSQRLDMSGYSVAINNKGETERIDISDIFQLSKKLI